MRSPTSALTVAAATLLALAACTSGGSTPAADATFGGAGPPASACLRMGSVRDLAVASPVGCDTAHQGQVYAVLDLPPSLTDPSVPQQVTAAKASLTCPDVRGWTGYRGTIPLGVFRTWRFPTRQQIAAGAHWVACVAILAPGPDHRTLASRVGTLKGTLAGVTDPLPSLGQCAPTHTNANFVPVACVPGSTQWVWLGAHRKPTGPYTGRANAKKVADQGCGRLLAQAGRQGAFVYYPTTAKAWARTRADWSCWMHLPGARS